MIIKIMRSVMNQIQRTFYGNQITPARMRVDHAGFWFVMAEQFPYIADVYPFLQEMGGVGMAQGLRGDPLKDARTFRAALQKSANAGGAIAHARGAFRKITDGPVGSPVIP